MPVTGVYSIRIGDVEAARTLDPAELGVEQQQAHQAEPEDRHRIADEAEDAHDLVDQAAAPDRREDAERDAEQRADQGAERRQFERRRKDAAMSVITGLVVSTELPKSPVSGLLHVDDRTARRAAGRGRVPARTRS